MAAHTPVETAGTPAVAEPAEADTDSDSACSACSACSADFGHTADAEAAPYTVPPRHTGNANAEAEAALSGNVAVAGGTRYYTVAADGSSGRTGTVAVVGVSVGIGTLAAAGKALAGAEVVTALEEQT